MSRSEFRTARLVVLLLYVVIAAAYSLVNPAFESPDELLHFDYVEAVLRTGRLPVAEAEASEYHQAPLYYVTGALLTAWLPAGTPAVERIERNPFWAWRIGEVGVDNKSQFLHGPEQDFPWTRHGPGAPWLRLHILRFFSILLGLIAVAQAGQFALLLWPGRYETFLLAMAFMGFLPQFTFVSSSITNDIAVVAFSALAAVALGQLLLSLSAKSFDVRHALALGLFLGLGVLSKASMFAVCALALGILSLYLLLNRRSTPRPSWGNLVLAAATMSAIAVPLLVRNWLVYGDPTALSRMDAIWGRREPPLTLSETLQEIPNIWTSFWARFGYGQIPVPNPIYVVCLVLTFIALVGLMVATIKRARALQPRARIWLFAYAGLLVLVFTAATLNYAANSQTGSFGRFFFPALPAAAVLLAGGWTQLVAPSRRPAIALAVSTLMLLFSVWALAAILRPAYVLPTSATAASTGPVEEQAGLRLGDVATLTRARLLNPTLTPGEDALLEVEWLPLRKSERPLIFFARLVSPENEMLSERDSYPGLGRTSTTLWEPGQVFTDLIRMPVDETAGRAATPAQVRVWVGFYDRATDQILLARDWPSGDPVLGVVGEGRLPAERRRADEEPGSVLATIGDNLELSAAEFPAEVLAGTTVPVTLEWTVLSPLQYDAKLFIHLTPVDQGQPLAQVDEAIMRGRYPRNLWAAGEVLKDSHQVQIPATLAPGTYRLRAGVYRDEPGWPRLPVVTPMGPAPDNAYDLGTIRVGSTSQ